MNEYAVQYVLAPIIAATLGFLALWLQEWRRQRDAENRHQRLLESSLQQSQFFSEWYKVQEGLGLPEPELSRYREEIQHELRIIYAEVQAGCAVQVERKDEPSPLGVTLQRLGRSLRFPRPAGWKLWGLAVLYYGVMSIALTFVLLLPFVVLDSVDEEGVAGAVVLSLVGTVLIVALLSLPLVVIRHVADAIRSHSSAHPVVATTPDPA